MKFPKLKSKLFRIGIAVFLFLSVIGTTIFTIHPVSASPVDAFWVGGSGNWSDATNHWAITSGGSPAVGDEPASTTNVYFDANSFSGNGQVCTADGADVCANMDWSGEINYTASVTIAPGQSLTIYGSYTGSSKSTLTTGSGTYATLNFSATSGTNTINLNGGTLTTGSAYLFINITGTATFNLANNLISSIPVNTFINVNNVGTTFNTQNYTVTVGTFNISNGAVVNFGTSTINLGVNSGNPWTFSGTNNLTANLSTIIISSTGGTGNYPFNNGTYGTVDLISGAGGYNTQVTGTNTFANLIFTGQNAINSYASFASNQTITNSLTFVGYSTVNRMIVESGTIGTPITLNCAGATINEQNVLIEDIHITGSPSQGTNSIVGNLGGNSGITFTTPANMYWYQNSGTWTTASNWYLGTNGTGGTGRVPLPQDTAIFDGNSISAAAKTITMITNYPCGSIVTTSVANTPTFSPSGNVITYGSITDGTIVWSVSEIEFFGRGSNTLTTDGVTMPQIYIGSSSGDGIGGTLTLQDAFLSTSVLTLYAGTLNTNGQSVTIPNFVSSTTTYARGLITGASVFTLNATTAITKWNVAATNFTLNSGTSTIISTNSSTNAQSFTGGGQSYYNLTIGGLGVYTFTFNDADSFNILQVDRSQAAKTITGTHTETIVQLSIPISSTTAVTITNTSFTQVSGLVSSEYLVITSSTASGGALFYAGTTSTNVSGNSGWLFSEPANPVVETLPPTQLAFTSVVLQGALDTMAGNANGYVCFEISTSPSFPTGATTETTKQYVIAAQAFYQPLTSLSSGTTYYYKARFYYSNSTLDVEGSSVSFATYGTSGSPAVTTLAASSITNNSAIISGNITNLGGVSAVTVFFEWGTDVTYANGQTAPQSFSTLSSFSYSLNSTNGITLSNGVTYHYQAMLTYIDGSGNTQTVLGGDLSFVAGIQGSTVIQILNVGVFNNYLTNSPTAYDTLIVMEVVNNYTGYINKTASKYFQVQLLASDDTTILAASNLQYWGDRPESIYLNSTVTTASITYGSPYYIRVIGYNVPTNPYEDYLIQPTDWQGSDLTQLDSTIMLIGDSMSLTDNQSYTTVLADGHSQITDNAVGFYVNGVPDITNVRPNDFTSSQLNSQFPSTSANNQWDSNTAWTTNVGTNISADATIMAAPFGITGKDFLASLIWLFILCVIGYTVSQGGKPLPALLLCVPIIWLGTYWKILPVQQLIVICIIFFFFGVRQFFIKTT
jgi:hypothetical protein